VALEATVETAPSSLGLPFDVWTSARLAVYLEERTGTTIAASWLWTQLGRRDVACGRPKPTLTHLQDVEATAAGEHLLAAVGEKVADDLEHRELHFEDETHLETSPYLCRVWHRKGEQPTLSAAGTNWQVTDFGSVEVVTPAQDSAAFQHYLEALEARHVATGRDPQPVPVAAFLQDRRVQIGVGVVLAWLIVDVLLDD